MISRQWAGKTQGGKFGHKAIQFLLPILGLRFIYGVTACVIPFYMLFARKGYLAIKDYLHNRIGLRGIDLWRGIYRNHFVFAQCMIDRFAMFSGLGNHFHFTIDEEPEFLEDLNKKEGILITGAHVGNLEMAGMALRYPQKAFNGLVFGMEEASLQNQRKRVLEQCGLQMIPVEQDMSHLIAVRSALCRGEAVVLHCDRSLFGTKTLELPFMGAKALFPIGAFHLAYNTKARVWAVFVMKGKQSRQYEVYARFVGTIPDEGGNKEDIISQWCRRYVEILEEMLARYPLQWFNFYPFWKREEE